jgi:hypothetical protein
MQFEMGEMMSGLRLEVAYLKKRKRKEGKKRKEKLANSSIGCFSAGNTPGRLSAELVLLFFSLLSV